MLIMEPAAPTTSATGDRAPCSLPPQDCAGWENIRNAGAFFDIPMPGCGRSASRMRCRPCGRAARGLTWRIEVDATELKGTCWRYDERGYEERFDWDLRRRGAVTGSVTSRLEYRVG